MEGQRANYRSQFSPSTLRILKLELRSSGFMASPSTYWPISLPQFWFFYLYLRSIIAILPTKVESIS